MSLSSKYLLDPRPPVVDNVINDFAPDANFVDNDQAGDHPHND